ncbi:MAG: bifunctional precorrin-2 dehydrogenase/sirohydrochlorin ferrochelatase [Myxococcales bacterium]
MTQVDEASPFPVALALAGRPVLVLGGGDEASDKLPRLLAAGARVTVVSPQVGPDIEAHAVRGSVRWFARAFHPSDLQGAHLVLLTDLDTTLATRLRELKRTYPFWLCAVDQPTFSDLFLVSTLTRGPVQIAISTAGKAPLLARRLRQELSRGLDAQFAEFARKFADLRARLRTVPKQRRKEQLELALNGFAIELRVGYPPGNPLGEVPPDGSGDP